MASLWISSMLGVDILWSMNKSAYLKVDWMLRGGSTAFLCNRQPKCRERAFIKASNWAHFHSHACVHEDQGSTWQASQHRRSLRDNRYSQIPSWSSTHWLQATGSMAPSDICCSLHYLRNPTFQWKPRHEGQYWNPPVPWEQVCAFKRFWRLTFLNTLTQNKWSWNILFQLRRALLKE